MTHVVHPYAHRLGIIRDWKSRWFGANRTNYRNFLKCDLSLREYLAEKLRGYYLAGIEIERSAKTLRIVLKTSRPGMIIGKSGEGIAKLRADITKFANRNKLVLPAELKLDVEEVRSPESNAAIVAYMVAEGLEKRLPFRRVLKQTVEKVMANRDVQGVKIALSGRLGAADMARREVIRKGRVPLQTFRADVDFCREKAHITCGDVGVKVWIYRGEIFNSAAHTFAGAGGTLNNGTTGGSVTNGNANAGHAHGGSRPGGRPGFGGHGPSSAPRAPRRA